MNADIGEACWRRGAFVDFSVTGWTGRDGMGRDGNKSRDSRDTWGGEFWERVHVFNQLVWDVRW